MMEAVSTLKHISAFKRLRDAILQEAVVSFLTPCSIETARLIWSVNISETTYVRLQYTDIWIKRQSKWQRNHLEVAC
jgi:hypothetical protein